MQIHLNPSWRSHLLPRKLGLPVNLKRSVMQMHKEPTRQCQVSWKDCCCFCTYFFFLFFSECTVLAWACWRHQYKLTLLFEGSLCLLIVYSKTLTQWEQTKCSTLNSVALHVKWRFKDNILKSSVHYFKIALKFYFLLLLLLFYYILNIFICLLMSKHKEKDGRNRKVLYGIK